MRRMVTRRGLVKLAGGMAALGLASCANRSPVSSASSTDSATSTADSTVDAASSASESTQSSETAASGIVLGTAFKDGSEYVINLSILDPATGDTSSFRKFSHDALSIRSGHVMEGGVPTRKSYSDDFTKMTITTVQTVYSTHEPQHVGWLTTEGEFHDVTKDLNPTPSDFGGEIDHRAPSFSSKGYFYYIDAGVGLMRVPLDNLSASAVETVAKDYDKSLYYIASDGTASGVLYSPDCSHVCADNDMNNSSDWIDNARFINVNGQCCEGIAVSGTQEDIDWSKDPEVVYELLPSVKGRTSFGFTLSPDRTQVAFLSYLDTDEYASVFVVPVEGGDPKKVAEGEYAKNANVNPIVAWI